MMPASSVLEAPANARSRRHTYLELSEIVPDSSCILNNPSAFKRFQVLAQALVDIAIEMTDLVDGDPELESNGDEIEDSDGG